MDCDKVRQVIFLYGETEMDEDLLTGFVDHMGRCPECVDYVQFTRRLFALIRIRCSRRVAPDGLRDRILQSLPHRVTYIRT